MADRTRAIVRLEVMEGMVTKGYRKGVYERVTKGITGESTGAAGTSSRKSDPLLLFPRAHTDRQHGFGAIARHDAGAPH